MGRAVAALPEGAELYEHSSVSIDGLRTLSQQLKHGWEVTGETYKCQLNAADRTGVFAGLIRDDDAYNGINWNGDIETLRDILEPHLAALGVGRDAVEMHPRTKRVKLTLPVLRKTDVADKAKNGTPISEVSKENVPAHEAEQTTTAVNGNDDVAKAIEEAEKIESKETSTKQTPVDNTATEPQRLSEAVKGIGSELETEDIDFEVGKSYHLADGSNMVITGLKGWETTARIYDKEGKLQRTVSEPARVLMRLTEEAERQQAKLDYEGKTDEYIRNNIDFYKKLLAEAKEKTPWDTDIIEIREGIIRGGKLELERRAEERAKAEREANEPTEAQKKAGNYKKKHVRVDGHEISIENERGSMRRGTDADGKQWETEMKHDYGYIRGTESVDGDHIDVFLSENPEQGDVFVVDQINEDGSFDEHKVMYGFGSEQEARDAYLSNYEDGWQGLGNITHVSKDEFKKWIQSSKRKTKPFAEYKSVDTKNNLFQYFEGSLKELITEAKAGVKGVIKKLIAPVSNRLQSDLSSQGLDISDDYNHVIDNNAIRHAINKHGGKSEEKRGQVSLTDEDFERIEDIVENYNEVRVEFDSTNAPKIIYSKSYSDGTTIYVEESRSKRKELAAVTMWKHKKTTLTDAKDTENSLSSDLGSHSERKDNASVSEKQEARAESSANEQSEPDVQTAEERLRENAGQRFDSMIEDQPAETVDDNRYEESDEVRAVRKVAKDWSAKLGTPIKVITRIEDIENDEALAQVMVARTSGWYDTKTGEVCIFAPHLSNTAEVETTVIHEVVAHKGLRALLGQKGYAAFLNGVWKSMTPEQRQYWMQYPGVNGNFQAAADEFVAHFAEYEDVEGERGVWGRIVATLKNVLRRMGLNLNVSETELRDVLKQAYRNLNSNTGKTIDSKESGIRFSAHGTFLGIGATPVFETREDGKRKMSIRIGDKIYDADNLITIEDLKADRRSPLSMMVEDARNKKISEDVINQCYESYASLVNLYLEYGNDPEIGSEALTATFLYLGDMASKPIATNSDSQYSLSQDITRICKKNEQMIRCIRELSKRQKWGATPAQIIDLFRTIDKEGLQTPCPVCYVFSRYLNSGKFATGLRDTFLAYQDKLQDITKIKDKEALVEYYNYFKAEFDKWNDWNGKNEKLINQATVDSKVLLLEIDQLGMKLMNYSLGNLELTPEQAQLLENKMQTLSDRYMAAVAIMGRAERAKIIKNAIFTGQTDSNVAENDYNKAVKCLRKGGHLFWHEDFGSPAPDINLTRRYPGYAAYRAAKGAAAGKVASGPSDYSFGDVSLGMGATKDHNTQFLLGNDKARKEKAFDAKVRDFDENNNLIEYDNKGKFIGYSDYDNYYIKASLAHKMVSDPKKAEALFDTWRKKAKNTYNNAYNRAQKQNLKGGTRMWSWSDVVPSLGGDMLMAEIENALLGVGVQAYSKQTEGIDLCGKLGIFINGSLIGDGNGYVEVKKSDIIERDGELFDKNPRTVWDPKTKAPGQFYEPVVETANGKYLKLAFDEKLGVKLWGSIDENTGNYQLGLFDLMQMHDTVNSITVGMNDIHIKLLLRSETFDFVIPWHSSGNDNHILTQMMSALGVNLRGFNPQDYQSIQSEHRIGEAVKKTKGEVVDEDSMTEEQKEAAEAARINASKNVSQDVVDFWESHKYEYDCGFGEIPSFKIKDGVLMVSDEQLAYRKLHDKIIKGGANRNSKVFIKPGTAEYDIIMNDEFLRQTYLTIRDSKAGTLSGAETHMVYPYEYWDKNSTRDKAHVNSQRYLEYCRRLGIIPKFCGIKGNQQMGTYGNFADEPGYWKLLIDRRMYDRAGNFQDMHSVSVNGITGKDIEEKEMRKRHAITELANDDKLSDIIDKTLEMSRDRLRRNASGKYVTREMERNARTKAEKENAKIVDGTINYDTTGEDIANAYADAVQADKIAGGQDANLTKFISPLIPQHYNLTLFISS